MFSLTSPERKTKRIITEQEVATSEERMQNWVIFLCAVVASSCFFTADSILQGNLDKVITSLGMSQRVIIVLLNSGVGLGAIGVGRTIHRNRHYRQKLEEWSQKLLLKEQQSQPLKKRLSLKSGR